MLCSWGGGPLVACLNPGQRQPRGLLSKDGSSPRRLRVPRGVTGDLTETGACCAEGGLQVASPSPPQGCVQHQAASTGGVGGVSQNPLGGPQHKPNAIGSVRAHATGPNPVDSAGGFDTVCLCWAVRWGRALGPESLPPAPPPWHTETKQHKYTRVYTLAHTYLHAPDISRLLAQPVRFFPNHPSWEFLE